MRGAFVAVVGPSGAGKDTLMRAVLARRPDILLARRVIAPARAARGEAFDAVDEETFERRRARGDFALDWAAHGHRYAIPTEVEASLAAGRCVLANCSRTVVDLARRRFAPFAVVWVTAPRETRARRLAARGREGAAEIDARLDRAAAEPPPGVEVSLVDNGGALDTAVEAFLAALPAPSPRRAPARQP